MGATFCVPLAKALTTAVLRRNKLPVPICSLFLLNSKLSPKRNVMLPHIDNINLIGTAVTSANRDRTTAPNALAANLWTNSKKDFSSEHYPYKEAIGLSRCKEGVLTVKPLLALDLFRSTNQIVSTKPAIPTQTRHMIGLWTYVLLLHWPAFSILSDTLRFSKKVLLIRNDRSPTLSSKSSM